MSKEQKTSKKQKSPKKETINLHAGHRDRVKDNFIENGFQGFNEHQILELVLFYGYPRIDTNELAHKLINQFGGLNEVLNASIEDLIQSGGLTKNCAVLLKLFTNIIREYSQNESSDYVFNTTQRITTHFEGIYKGETEEKVYISVFDDELRLKKTVLITKGTIAFVPMQTRKIAYAVLNNNSSYAAIAHNHPNSSARPSDEDIIITNGILSVLRSLGVILLDHVIIGTDGSYSMCKSGHFKI